MARNTLSAEERETLRRLDARTRQIADQAMVENLFRKGLIKMSAFGGYSLKIEGRAALRAA